MDPAELCRIWDEYQPRLLLIARACAGGLWGRGEELAEDAVQEAFIELTAQPIVPRDPLGWLVRVARNRLIDWQRSDQRRQQRELARRQVSERASWFVATDCGDTVASEELTVALRALPDRQREIVVMVHWGAMTYEQIAELVDCSTSTVHRHYAAALKELRGQFDRENFYVSK